MKKNDGNLDDKVTKKKEETTIEVEVKENKKKQENKDTNNKNIWIFIIAVLVLILIIFLITKTISSNDNQDIKSVKRVLKSKYTQVECIDSYCTGIVAIKGDKLKKYTVELINEDGKKVASYKETYNSKDKNLETPYALTDKYFLMKTTNSEDVKNIKYSIMSTKGKDLYSTNNKLKVINENFILMENDDDKYSILNTKGKEIYNDISDIDTYINGKYISFQIDDNYMILDEEGEKILDNYKIAKAVRKDSDENDILYFIVQDIKNDTYYYYDIDEDKIIGDGFISYDSSNEEGSFIITKKKNNNTIKYTLDKDGKQTKLNENEDTKEVVSEIKKQIDSNTYYLYSVSVTKKGQKNVLVDNKVDKSLGILNLDTNKYAKLYEYNNENSYVYSTVDRLNDDDNDLYLRISCSKENCGNFKTIIYDFEHTKEVYKVEDDNLVVSDYIEYEGDYKVVKYSNSSSSSEYKGKYVLYNKNNKELLKSQNRIVLVDKKISFGNEYNYSLTLYSTKKKKTLNKESEEASIITIDDTKLYKYIDEDNNIVICDLDGNKIISSKDNYLKYSSTGITYLDGERISMYDVKKGKTKSYTLKENEKINDASGDVIPPYRGAVFINNTADQYIKIINSKAKVLKKIKNAEVSLVKQNPRNKNVFIIVKEKGDTGNLYGLYIAK